MVWGPFDGKKPTKEPEFCSLLNNWVSYSDGGLLEFGATRYTIHFMEGCVKPEDTVICSIRISTGSYSGVGHPHDVQLHPFYDLLNFTDGAYDLPDVGRLNVSAGVDEDGVTFPPELEPNEPNELNVFTERQALPIDHFRISFNDVKNGALLATCETTSDLEDIWFVTYPTP